MKRPSLADLAATLRGAPGLAAKGAIATAAQRFGFDPHGVVPVGDDCAAIPEGDGHLLLAIEGFINAFVAADPWFAGWCGVMVNLSDVAAMGGRPTAIVDAVWARDDDGLAPLVAGLRAASERYGVPIVGGHTNARSDQPQLAVAVLGRARRLLTSFDARPGDRLVAAIDLGGRYRAPFDNWDAATDAPPEKLRGDLALLPRIAEAGLARAGKDISQSGLVGTAAMLAECSGIAITIDVDAVPRPPEVPLARWLTTFPSYGYLLAVAECDVAAVVGLFAERGIVAAGVGAIEPGSRVAITDGIATEVVRDLSTDPLLGCARPPA